MDLTLVVMAAGMGSRFGGLKQTTPIDADGNFIMDYSIYDAILAGFTKVVFVIREEHLELFKESIGKRLEGKISVSYALQKLEDIPRKMDISGREKPWGTGQAILSAKPYVSGSFIVLNADDFYGRNAYFVAAKFLREVKRPYLYANISYAYGVTKSLEGAVKRGVLSLDGDLVKSIVESSVDAKDGRIIATPLSGEESFAIEENHPVSMNFFAFQYDVFALLEEYLDDYFKQEEEIILKEEVLLPECLKLNISRGKITVVNQPSDSMWLGMTYRSDLPFVEEKIASLKKSGVYKNHLWE